jgi:predicted dehydrogenase
MSTEIPIGVIGMGWMGQAHSRSYRAVPLRFPASGLRPRLVVCSDAVAERADDARAVLGFEESTTDWKRVVTHPDVQVVNIAAPNDLHVEIARAAAQNGKHIMCEKPVGRSPAETAEIARTVADAGVLSFVGYNYRWAPLVQYLRELITDGRLGDIVHYRGWFFSMYGSNPHGLLSWRFQQGLAGYGVLADLLSHVIDMAHLLAGPIERVSSTQHTWIRERPLPIPGSGTHYGAGQPGDPTGEVTNEDYVAAVVEFGNGARGVLEAARTLNGPESQMAFEIFGTRGSARWDFERMNEMQLYLRDDDPARDGYTRLLADETHPYQGNFVPGAAIAIGYEDLKVVEAYEFLRSVAAGTQGAPGLPDALAVATVQQAMVESWGSGAWEPVRPIPMTAH